MADRFYSTQPYGNGYARPYYKYETEFTKTSPNQPQIDIKQSNISQQTIIHKARLYSPDKSQQIFRNNNSLNYQPHDRTKTKKQIDKKIYGIVDLCERDRDASIQQFKDVVGAQKGIVSALRQNQLSRNVPNINLSQFDQGYDRGTTFGPYRHPTNNLQNIQQIQSKQVTNRQTRETRQTRQGGNGERPTPFKDNIYKKSAIDDLKTDRNIQEQYAQQIQQTSAENYTQTQKQQRVSKQTRQQSRDQGQTQNRARSPQHYGLTDDTYVVLQEIERKAMDQIESLRADKIELMKRLNQEIRAHNQQKKLRIQLQQELARLKGVQPQNRIKANAQRSAQIQQKSYSQPHFNQTQPRFRETAQLVHPPHSQQEYIEQPYFAQTQQTIPSQTYYPPYQPEEEIISPIPRKGQQSYPDQNQAVYQRQLNKVQRPQINKMGKNTVGVPSKQVFRNMQKQSLIAQINKLNQRIRLYQIQIQRLSSKKGGDNQIFQSLLNEGERIRMEAQRLHNMNAQKQNYPSNGYIEQGQFVEESSDFHQDFKRRLIDIQQQNQRLKQNASRGAKRDFNEGLGRASLPVNNRSSRNIINAPPRANFKMQEYQSFIGQIRSAVSQ